MIAFAFGAALAAPSLAEAQDNSSAPAPPAAAQAAPAAAGSEQPPPAQSLFSRAELEKLLAPIALYPDALLAQLLAASAYPLQIVEAQRWLDKNKAAVANNDFSWIDSQDWDPAVKALARFPDVVTKMSDDLEWTTDLGDAEVNQPQDVADVIQELRVEAEKAGALKTAPQQTVSNVFVDDGSYITIEPAEPSIVYVPSYEPVDVYEPAVAVAPLLTFGAGIVVGAPRNRYCWNWRTGAIYPPAWAGYPGWRPPYPGWRPGQPVWPGGGHVGGNIDIGANPKPWRPGPDYRPRLGPGVGANRSGNESIMVDRSPDGTTITIRRGNTIDRAGGGNNIVSTRPAAGSFVSNRRGGNFVDTRPSDNFVNAQPGASNFVNTRPAGNFVNTPPGTSKFINSRPGGGTIVPSRPGGVSVFNHSPSPAVAHRVAPVLPNFSPPGGVSVINRAPSVGVAPRVAPVLPNFSPPGVPVLSGIRPGVAGIPTANRGVISRGPVSGGLVGGATVRPGGFGVGGLGAGLR